MTKKVDRAIILLCVGIIMMCSLVYGILKGLKICSCLDLKMDIILPLITIHILLYQLFLLKSRGDKNDKK